MKKLFILVVFLMVCSISFGQLLLNPQDQVKLDPNVRVGKLENGLTYYIRHNEMPDNRADFYIATNVGAINETPAQRGLAHFLEHMCFNGNKDFPGNTMLPYLEKNGLTFGGNINAMTGVEQTIYTFYNVPTQNPGLIDTTLLILQNDAYFVTNDFEEIEKERGVIIEEWRSGNSAQRRAQEELFKVLFKGTKYENCNVIGDEECLLSFAPEELVKFYKTWYYPGNQAIIVVGDVDVDYIENKIKELFSIIPKKEDIPVKEVITIPDNEEPVACVYSDSELFMSNVALIIKGERFPEQLNSTGAAIFKELSESLIVSMLNERLSDASKEPNSLFSDAAFSISKLAKPLEGINLVAIPKDNNKCMEALAGAIDIVRQATKYGFTEEEFNRTKTEIIRGYQSRVDNAATRRNGSYAMDYVNHFLENQPYTEPEYIKQVVEQYLNMFTVNLINQTLAQDELITKKNSVIYYVAPKKDGIIVPTTEEVVSAYLEALNREVAPKEKEEVLEDLLDPSKIQSGKITKIEDGFLGSKVLTLSNKIQVYLYPTDVSKDRVSIDLFQKGGLALLPVDLLPPFESNIRSVYSSDLGVSKFTQNQLYKMLAGKIASASPYIGENTSGISASGSTKDLETIFQLAYLQYTEPRCEDADFNRCVDQLKLLVGQLDSNPDIKFSKMLLYTMSNNHPRTQFISAELLEKATADKVRKAYSTFLNDAVGAKMIMVGDFEIEAVKPLIEKYIASLPVKSEKEREIVNHKMIPPKGKIDVIESFEMQNPKTSTAIVYSGDMDYTLENSLKIGAYGYIMSMRFTESLREEDGGTYSPSASGSLTGRLNPMYSFSVSYQTQFEKSEGLLKKVYDGVAKIAEEGPSDEELAKAKEMYKKRISENKKSLSYWSNLLESYYRYNEDRRITEELIDKVITKENIHNIAKMIANSENRINVTLNPNK